MIENSPLVNYLKYVQSVLGIHEFINTENEKTNFDELYPQAQELNSLTDVLHWLAKLQSPQDLVVIHCLQNGSTSSLNQVEEKNLLAKMLKAIGYDLDSILHFQVNTGCDDLLIKLNQVDFKKLLSKSILVLSEHLPKCELEENKKQIWVTFTPRVLLDHPDKKRLAWETLKALKLSLDKNN